MDWAKLAIIGPGTGVAGGQNLCGVPGGPLVAVAVVWVFATGRFRWSHVRMRDGEWELPRDVDQGRSEWIGRVPCGASTVADANRRDQRHQRRCLLGVALVLGETAVRFVRPSLSPEHCGRCG